MDKKKIKPNLYGIEQGDIVVFSGWVYIVEEIKGDKLIVSLPGDSSYREEVYGHEVVIKKKRKLLEEEIPNSAEEILMTEMPEDIKPNKK